MFLVVVDVVRKEAFWIFVQEWEAKFRRRETWRSQKSVTINIPAANRLSNPRLFRQALRHADTFMATRKTEAVTDAIKDSAAALKGAKRIQRSTGTQSMALRQRSRFAVLTVDQASRIRIPLNLVPWVVNERSFRHLFPLSFLYGPEYYGPLDAWVIADLHGDAEEFNGLPPSDWFISPATLSARATDDPNAALLNSLIFELELYRHSNGVRLTIPRHLREIDALPSTKGKVIVFKHASVISICSLDAYKRSVRVAAADATS